MVQHTPPIIIHSREKLKAAATTLAEAFLEYPLYTYALPDPNIRFHSLQVLFEVLGQYAADYGTVYATSDQVEGVMLCLPKSTSSISNWGMVKSGALKLLLKPGIGFIKRLGIILPIQDRLQSKLANIPHVYLWSIGVKPTCKGQGHAAHLIRHLQKILTLKKEAGFLETMLERNVRLYEHLGFSVMDTVTIENLSLTNWAMLWKPESH